jgi:hypothetical protein
MPEKETVERAKEDLKEGKSPSTAAGEFVREEIHHIREGKHGARSTEQAIAIGLSKARRAGVPLKTPKRASKKTRKAAARDAKVGRKTTRKRPAKKRARAALKRLKRAGRKAATKKALSRHAKKAARKRPARERSASAKKAARTRKRTAAKKRAR